MHGFSAFLYVKIFLLSQGFTQFLWQKTILLNCQNLVTPSVGFLTVLQDYDILIKMSEKHLIRLYV